MRGWFIVCGALVLAGCQTVQAPAVVWMRVDGQSGKDNPAIAQQFEIDSTICKGQVQQTNMVATPIMYGGLIGAIQQIERNTAVVDVVKGCMASRGYVLVPASEVEARAAAARAIAANQTTPLAKSPLQ